MVTVMRSKLRAWWPELLCAAILAVISFAGQPDDFLFAVFVAIMVGIGWALGFRHRHHPVIDAIHETYAVTKRLEQADAAAREPSPPRLTLHHGGKAHT